MIGWITGSQSALLWVPEVISHTVESFENRQNVEILWPLVVMQVRVQMSYVVILYNTFTFLRKTTPKWSFGSLPKGSQWQGLCQAEFWSQELHPSLTQGRRNPSPWPIIICLPGTLTGSWIRSGVSRITPSTLPWGVGISSNSLTPCITMLTPKIKLWDVKQILGVVFPTWKQYESFS